MRAKRTFLRAASLLLTMTMVTALLCGTAFAGYLTPDNGADSEMPEWLRTTSETVSYSSDSTPPAWLYTSSSAVVENELPNTDITVIPSDANALVLMDVGAQSPRGVPGDVVTIVLPVAVNREYLPTERYILRNITVEPAIPTDTSVSNWPFDLINASYVRHLEDMSYNSTAEIYYDFRISQFATKGVYPVNFKVTATVWRMDDTNGTEITEDVTFDLCVYLTITDDGSQSGETTTFDPLQVAASNQSGAVSIPSAKPDWAVTMKIPVVNKGGTLKNVTVEPVVTTSLDTFPFVASTTNFGLYFEEWAKDEIKELTWNFAVSPYATNGNKVITFNATYYENGQSAECTFTSQINIFDGYEKPVEEPEVIGTAMSVMVTGYQLLVDGEEVKSLTAGEDAVLRLTLANNAGSATALKNIVSLSFANTTDLALAVGSSNAAYVSSINAGETATVDFEITAAHGAEVGLATLGVGLNYETADYVAGSASQNIMIPVSQRMEIVADAPVVYGTPVLDTPASMSVNLVNMGQAKALNLRILAEDGLSMAESYFGGDLLPGGALTADISVNCEKAGDYDGKLLIQFEDANGEQYIEEVPVPLSVLETAAVQGPDDDDGAGDTADKDGGSGGPWWPWLLLALLVIAVVVAAVVIVRKRRAKKLEADALDDFPMTVESADAAAFGEETEAADAEDTWSKV